MAHGRLAPYGISNCHEEGIFCRYMRYQTVYCHSSFFGVTGEGNTNALPPLRSLRPVEPFRLCKRFHFTALTLSRFGEMCPISGIGGPSRSERRKGRIQGV